MFLSIADQAAIVLSYRQFVESGILTKIVIVLAGLFFAVMVGYPLMMLVLGSMALPNIIAGVIFGSLLLYVDAFIVWMYVTE